MKTAFSGDEYYPDRPRRFLSSDWSSITAIDAHTAGEPLRVITGGLPSIPGKTMLAKRRYAQKNLDRIRTALMWEPRGHADMYGCIPTEPVTKDGHLGVLFLHNDGFSTMCGHGIIGLVKVALDAGLIEADIDAGRRIKQAVTESIPVEHPIEKDLSFLYGVIFTAPPHNSEHHSRNVCVFADGEVDRSPTGTGVSARAALHYSRGELEINEPFIVESILGTCFTGRVRETVPIGRYEAVIPEVTGTAFICGRNELLIDPDDPLKHGFFLR